MNNKNVVSLELSKRLKEVGYPQTEGEFWWHKKFGEYYLSNDKTPLIKLEGESYIAPLASELVEKLPGYLLNKKREMAYSLSIEKMEELDRQEPYYVCYNPLQGQKAIENFGNTLCNALAKMWLYLKKNNLLEEKND